MNYDLRLLQKGIKKIHYFGNPIFVSLRSAILPAVLLALLYKYVLLKNILYLQGENIPVSIVMAMIYLISFIFLYKKRRYIQWNERDIRFKNIDGYTAIIGVDKIESIKIEKRKGIYITHNNFYDEKRNGTYLIPFENLGRNYNTDVDIITEDFKKLYPNLIIDDMDS